MNTSWNADEDEALQGLPMESQLVYLRGLRRHMDYGTGVVGGARRRISWQMLSEVVEVEHHRGMAGRRMTKQALRRAVDWLVKAGLVQQLKADRHLVFRLLLADVGFSVPEKAGPRPDHVRTTKAGPRPDHRERNQDNGLDDMQAETRTQLSTPETAKPGIHQVSGITKHSIAQNSAGIPRGRVDPDHWQALQACFPENTQLAGQACREMLSSWQAAGNVTSAHIRQAVQQIRDRNPNLSFGPAYIASAVRDIANGKQSKAGRPAWARVPSVDDELWPWAQTHGYPGPGTMTFQQYRSRLWSEVEKRVGQQGVG